MAKLGMVLVSVGRERADACRDVAGGSGDCGGGEGGRARVVGGKTATDIERLLASGGGTQVSCLFTVVVDGESVRVLAVGSGAEMAGAVGCTECSDDRVGRGL